MRRPRPIRWLANLFVGSYSDADFEAHYHTVIRSACCGVPTADEVRRDLDNHPVYRW